MSLEINIVSKDKIYPAFGYAFPEKELIYIRVDLPYNLYKFVLSHEKYHITDKAKFWLWREIKANVVAAYKYPIGFIECLIMSLTYDRFKYYVKRIIKGE